MTFPGDDGDAERLPPALKAENPIESRLGGEPSRWAVGLFWVSVAALVVALALLISTFFG